MDNKKRPGPDFLCIGMQKGGTKWIYDAMSQLPGVFMPPVKEANHFTLQFGHQKKDYVNGVIRRRLSKIDKEYPEVPTELREKFRRAANRYMKEPSNKHYRQMFCMADGKYTGDITPAYSLLSASNVQKVHDFLPDARIVFSIRHPLSRAWSQFNMFLRQKMEKNGVTNTQMQREIQNYSTTDAFARFLEKPRPTMLSSASIIYDNWSKHYNDLIVIDFTDIVKRPATVLCRLSKELLAVPMQEDDAPEVPNVKETMAKAKITPAHTEIGLAHFKEEIARCRARFDFCASWEG